MFGLFFVDSVCFVGFASLQPNDFVAMTKSMPLDVRFIEWMKFDRFFSHLLPPHHTPCILIMKRTERPRKYTATYVRGDCTITKSRVQKYLRIDPRYESLTSLLASLPMAYCTIMVNYGNSGHPLIYGLLARRSMKRCLLSVVCGCLFV